MMLASPSPGFVDRRGSQGYVSVLVNHLNPLLQSTSATTPNAPSPAAEQKNVEDANMRDHGFALYVEESKKAREPYGDGDLYEQVYVNTWPQFGKAGQQIFIDKAIAAKGLGTCKKPCPKPLKRTIDKVDSDDEDANEEFASNAGDPNSDDIYSDEEFEGVYMDESPSQVRAKVKRYIANTGCTQKKLQEGSGISAHSFTAFMRAMGQDGSGTNCYFDAWKFFKKKKRKSLSAVPKKEKAAKKAKTATTAEDKKKEEAKKKEDEKWDVSDIHIDGEEDDSIPIYDTCDDIRKIRAHEKTAGYVQAAFCCELSEQMSSGVKVTGATLRSFLAKKGPREGAASAIFYAAYVYFEKLRIKQGKPWTEKREIMEDKWGSGLYGSIGVPRKAKESYLCLAGDELYEDEYGCPVIVRGGRRVGA